MNKDEEEVDPEVIGEIVQQVVAQLSGKWQRHNGGSTQSSQRVVKGEFHRIGIFGPSSNDIAPSGRSSGGLSERHNSGVKQLTDMVLQLSLSQNQNNDIFNRRLNSNDEENKKLEATISDLKQQLKEAKATISDLTQQLKETKAEDDALKDRVSRLEEKNRLFESDIKELLAEKEKRVFNE